MAAARDEEGDAAAGDEGRGYGLVTEVFGAPRADL
jgi:hypothetical protein